jgi:thymidylate kinase
MDIVHQLLNNQEFLRIYDSIKDCDFIAVEGHRCCGKSTIIKALNSKFEDENKSVINYSCLGSVGGRKSFGIDKLTGKFNIENEDIDIGMAYYFALDLYLQIPKHKINSDVLLCDRSTVSSFVFGHASVKRLNNFKKLLGMFNKPIILFVKSRLNDIESKVESELKRHYLSEQLKFSDALYPYNLPVIEYIKNYF